MTTVESKHAMTEFSGAGTLYWNFTGGEPLLREDIGELLGFAKDLGFSSVLDTNGTLIVDRIDDILELRGFGVLNVSLDGPEEIHDRLRGEGTFKRVVEGIRLAKDNRLRVHLCSVITRQNTENDCQGIRELLEIAKELDCPIYPQPLYTSKYNAAAIGDYTPLNEDYTNVFKIFSKFSSKNPSLVNTSKVGLEYFKSFFDVGISCDCLAGVAYGCLLPDGTVTPCFFREDLSLNGLKIGFVKAFKMLPAVPNSCHCIMPCYSEYNRLYSFNISEVLFQINRFR